MPRDEQQEVELLQQWSVEHRRRRSESSGVLVSRARCELLTRVSSALQMLVAIHRKSMRVQRLPESLREQCNVHHPRQRCALPVSRIELVGSDSRWLCGVGVRLALRAIGARIIRANHWSVKTTVNVGSRTIEPSAGKIRSDANPRSRTSLGVPMDSRVGIATSAWASNGERGRS